MKAQASTVPSLSKKCLDVASFVSSVILCCTCSLRCTTTTTTTTHECYLIRLDVNTRWMYRLESGASFQHLIRRTAWGSGEGTPRYILEGGKLYLQNHLRCFRLQCLSLLTRGRHPSTPSLPNLLPQPPASQLIKVALPSSWSPECNHYSIPCCSGLKSTFCNQPTIIIIQQWGETKGWVVV